MAVATPGTTTSFTLSTASAAVCAANPFRRGIMITNNDASIKIFAAFGTSNVATTSHIPIPAGGSLTVSGGMSTAVNGQGTTVPNGDVALIAASGTPVASVTEW